MKHTRKILALVLIVMTVLMSLSVISVSAEDAETGTKTVVRTFETTDIDSVAANQYQDGEFVEAGTDNFFTIVFRTTSKTEDGKDATWGTDTDAHYYSASRRLSLAAGTPNSRAYIAFKTEHANATLKVWWVSNKKVNNVDLIDGENVTNVNSFGSTEDEAKNKSFYNEVTLAAAGTYQLYHVGGTNYIYKIEVSWTEALADSSTCEHEWQEANCDNPKTCPKCNLTEGEALGHAMEDVTEIPATCMTDGSEAGQTCSRCGKKEGQAAIAATGHKYTFTVTQPTATSAGSITGTCSVEGCGATFESGEFNVMTPGNSYDLQASDLGVIATKTLSDGYVKVVDGVFACHLSYKLRVDDGREKYDSFGQLQAWTSTHRINLQSASEILEDGTIKNFIQIVTTGKTTITVAWGTNKANRELAVYNLDGTLATIIEVEGTSNPTQVNASGDELVVSEFVLPAGAYLIGNYIPETAISGGSYIHRVMVDVECTEHTWTDATCTAKKTCSVCGATEGELLAHTWVDATCTAKKTCSVCGATEGELAAHNYVDGECSNCKTADPNYTPEQPEQPTEPEQPEEPELNFFQKILAWFMDLINKILGIFKK